MTVMDHGWAATRSTPTAYQLQAALLAARVLDPSGNTPDSLIVSYDQLATGGLYRSQDLQAGHTLLQRAKLVSPQDSRHVPTPALLDLCDLPDDVATELLLQELFVEEPPLWLYAAVVDDEVRWENVPQADQDALEQLLEDAARREALLMGLGRTLDAAQLHDQGARGEEYVVELCRQHLNARSRPDLAAAVKRVSLRSDQLGYDVTSSDTTGRRHRIEVKTTSSASVGRVDFFISRNEVVVGARDPGWSLVAVRRNRDGGLELLGWCSAISLTPHLPRDVSPQGRWSSVRLSVAITEFAPGLPLDAGV
ncbi:DUF3883 domain-containing protein [Nocardioides sp. zg-579]|uniref:DUF3883 domain-containing protein n=2 Tax=Nocardioides marmotae TaxID=2663857 RepID=A0A6I3JGZ1_9ACTN|nr:DUF3883 domain-containing protein [Gordonia jinghuaiqii]MTB97315.1 DUF3883 domain-containing protein [Nocardioides marmotae]QKE01784.1 DUF3883 domain-containing protein [Nocardioides marmotae]